jgi:hypothetical protein
MLTENKGSLYGYNPANHMPHGPHPRWYRIFEAYMPVRKWLAEKKPDVLFLIYNDHVTSFFSIATRTSLSASAIPAPSAPSRPPRRAYSACVISVSLIGVLLDEVEEFFVPRSVVETGPFAVDLV